jgi:Domain of unknown function (DUF1707)
MMAGPGGEIPPVAAADGRLRASHDDREHAIDTLKAAFAQGRLTKDEFDERVSQAFASRTYAELGAITADIPTGLTAAPPPTAPTRAQARPPVNLKAGVRASIVISACAALIWTALIFTNDVEIFLSALGASATAFVAWFLTGTQMIGSWLDKRSGTPGPPRPASRAALAVPAGQFPRISQAPRDAGETARSHLPRPQLSRLAIRAMPPRRRRYAIGCAEH